MEYSETVLENQKRNRNPGKCKGYRGEIYGFLTPDPTANSEYYRLTIYVGEADRDVKRLKGTPEPLNPVNKMRFYFPHEELELGIFLYSDYFVISRTTKITKNCSRKNCFT